MEIEKTYIDGLLILKPKIHYDNRGSFMETYNLAEYSMNNLMFNFVQDNQSISHKGVLRGIHFQKEHPQTKLIRVIKGAIYDVAVDLRKNSSTFGQYFGIILSSENNKQLLIPKGFGHGFFTMNEDTIVAYKVDTHYVPNDEGGIKWDDAYLNIDWPIEENQLPLLSIKDSCFPSLDEILHIF